MGLRGDERGQAVQVGAVLLLAIFVIMLSLYQATVIPNENKQVEFNDYQDATADIADLRNAILRSAAQDDQSGATIRTGSQYPARSLFVNPPPATGRLSSSPASNVTIANVESAGDYENVGKYLAAEGNALNVSTRRLVFDPSYNELDVAPVATAYGATYRTYDDPIFTTGQTLVEGNRITLVSVAGDLSAGGHSTPVTVEPVSAHTRTISVAGDGGPLNLTVPTELSATVWEDQLLASQMAPGGHVQAVTPGPRPGTVNVSLEAGQTYELRLGRVEVRERSNSVSEQKPPARYLVSEVDRKLRTGSDGRIKLVVEARDRYNNPVSNKDVTFNQPSNKGTFERADGTPVTFPMRTGENGRATVYYNATGYVGNLPVKVYLGASEPAADERKTLYTVTNLVTGGGGGGAGGDSNINPGSFVVLTDATKVNNNPGRIEATFTNQGQVDANITEMKFPFYFEFQGNTLISAVEVYKQTGANSYSLAQTLPHRGGFKDIDPVITFSSGTTTKLRFQMKNSNNNNYSPDPKKVFFVVEVVYDDAFVATYFVSFS